MQIANSNLQQRISELESENQRLSKTLIEAQSELTAEKERFLIVNKKYMSLKKAFTALQEEISENVGQGVGNNGANNVTVATNSHKIQDQRKRIKSRRVSSLDIQNTAVSTTDAVRRLSFAVNKRGTRDKEIGVPLFNNLLPTSESPEEQMDKSTWF